VVVVSVAVAVDVCWGVSSLSASFEAETPVDGSVVSAVVVALALSVVVTLASSLMVVLVAVASTDFLSGLVEGAAVAVGGDSNPNSSSSKRACNRFTKSAFNPSVAKPLLVNSALSSVTDMNQINKWQGMEMPMNEWRRKRWA